VPESALREAVLNALIHKDYATGTPVQISVYADKLMVWNPGQLRSTWTVEKLKGKHASQPFNPDLAYIFFRAGEIEAWGRGIERILAACREARFPEPVIEQEATGLWIIFPFSPMLVAQVIGPVSEKTSEKTSLQVLSLLASNPELALTDVAKQIGKTSRTVERIAAKQIEMGRRKRIEPDKGGLWHVLQ
jgi:ATP-dependent DNA helicase RecG